jgi:hypothetical protein
MRVEHDRHDASLIVTRTWVIRFVISLIAVPGFAPLQAAAKLGAGGSRTQDEWTLRQEKGVRIDGIPGYASGPNIVNMMDIAQGSIPHDGRTPENTVPPPVPPSGMPTIPERGPVDHEKLAFPPPYGSQGASPSPSASFEAIIDSQLEFLSSPSDATGTAGVNHMMVVTNGLVRVQSKDGTILSTVTNTAFWTIGHAGGADPRVIYDPYSSRWIMSVFSGSVPVGSNVGPGEVKVAVSATSDPTGAWYQYLVDYDPADQTSPDYPTLGFNKDWIVINSATVSASGGVTSGKVYVFNKASLYAGGLGTVSQFAVGPNTKMPASTYDASLSTVYLVETVGTGLIVSTITGPANAPVFTSGVYSISAPGGLSWTNFPPSMNYLPQACGNGIDALDGRIQTVAFRNGSLWCAHHAFLSGPSRASVQWWEVDLTGSPVVMQFGRVDDATGQTMYAFPNLAVNANDDMLIGYSRFSGTQFPSSNYAFRAGTDPLNTLRDDTVIRAGTACWVYDPTPSFRNRFGDYCGASPDPNGTDLWAMPHAAYVIVSGRSREAAIWARVALRGDRALQFNGTSQYVRVPSTGTISPTGAMTVEAWIKPSALGSNRAIVSKRDASNGGYELRLNNSNQVVFATYANDGSVRDSVTTTDTVALGQWQHVAGVYDATVGQERLRVTLRGMVTSKTSTANPRAGGSNLNIGRSGTAGNHFSGIIDDVRLSNVARYAADFVQSKNHVNDLSTLGLWKLDDGAGTLVVDASGNLDPGTAVSGPSWVTGVTGGVDTPGLYTSATGAFQLRNSNSSGPANVTFTFGAGGAKPMSGDWNGDGTSTIGLYDPATSTFFLRNSNTAGGADVTFSFGAANAGWLPISGDWNGDGIDTVGLFDPASGAFFLRNSNAAGPADLTISFGAGGASMTPVAGDWNGDGVDTIGFYNAVGNTFFLRNSNSPGGADLTFVFGGGALFPVAGDWNGDKIDTVGVYNPASGDWFLVNSNASGPANIVFSYGAGGAAAITGDWDNQ